MCVYNGTVHGVNLLAKYLSSVHWCHAWHSCVVPVICVLLRTSQRLQMQCTLLIESQMSVSYSICKVYYMCVTRPLHFILKRWPFEKPDSSLNKNYTVTRLDVAFLMIVCRVSCFEGGSNLKALRCQLATECIIRQVMYLFVHICSYEWNLCWLLTPVNLNLRQLSPPEWRSIFLSSVYHEGTNWYSFSWFVLF